jgi:hypothetical protein
MRDENYSWSMVAVYQEDQEGKNTPRVGRLSNAGTTGARVK